MTEEESAQRTKKAEVEKGFYGNVVKFSKTCRINEEVYDIWVSVNTKQNWLDDSLTNLKDTDPNAFNIHLGAKAHERFLLRTDASNFNTYSERKESRAIQNLNHDQLATLYQMS